MNHKEISPHAQDGPQVHSANFSRSTSALVQPSGLWRKIKKWTWVLFIDLDLIVFICAIALTGIANSHQSRYPAANIRPFFVAETSTWVGFTNRHNARSIPFSYITFMTIAVWQCLSNLDTDSSRSWHLCRPVNDFCNQLGTQIHDFERASSPPYATQNPWTEPDTVPIWTVFVFGYVVLSSIIGISEYFLALYIRQIPPKRSVLTALRFAFGLWTSTMVAVMLVEIGKNYVGRLRPSFAERCLGPGAVPPKDASSLLRVLRDDSECTAGGAWEGRRSFPSGHASLSVGMGVYFQMWTARIAARGACQGGIRALAVYVAGLAVFTLGLWVAASRVVDNAHHVSDVAVGAAIGGWLAAIHFQMVAHETDRLENLDRNCTNQHMD